MGLPNHAIAQHVLQGQDGGDLILHHLADGNAGPAGDDFADDLRVHADADQARLALQRRKFALQCRELGPQLCGIAARRQGAVAVAAAVAAVASEAPVAAGLEAAAA